ncbi:hypothetical protein [Natrialba sp. INN-245]|uniref:hypothetical protein n=1 Tax=Natrialba sp. INN-245 TaxID=2690967 RepID=UPI00131255E1|nr:hypothetical protein [Natrialba sp. INN-245]MWV41114.1 hypothetical protein [Natrialba sp. INN-245]
MTDRPVASRRRFLAGVAAASMAVAAGCNETSIGGDDGPTRFSPSEVDPILEQSRPEADRPVPIEPDDDVIGSGIERVDDLLADVPDPVPVETVPNGVVRESIDRRRESATDDRSDALEPPEPSYRALRVSVPGARESARGAAVTLSAVDADPDLDDLAAEYDEAQSTVDDRLEGLEYRGDDSDDGRLRAALVAADREDDLASARRTVDRWRVTEHTNVVDLGESAGDVEFVEATVDAWDHLADRYDADVDGVDLEPVFSDALAVSIDAAGEVDLPDQGESDWLDELVEGELEMGFPQTLLWDAVRPVYDARDRMIDAREDGRLGTGLAAAIRFEQEYRAFRTVRDRFEDGDLETPASIDEVRAEREAAIDAAESAMAAFTRPSLASARLAETLQTLEWTDDRIQRDADRDPDRQVSVSDEYSEYACLRARFDALSDAAAAVRERLLE